MRNQKVDQYLVEGCMRCELGGTPQCKVLSWTNELETMRQIVLETGLKEEVKWGVPCYTFQDKNILLVSALKEFSAISFFKGSLLKDPANVLVAPGKNSQASRYLKFKSVDEIIKKEQTIKEYIREAVEIEKSGKKVEFKKNPEPMPEELEQKMEEDPYFRDAFERLTPGRQRGYIIFFSQPKQSQTRISRIEKCTSKILNGEGLHDKYQSMKKKS